MAKTEGQTYLEDVIDPEVMATVVQAKIKRALKAKPYIAVNETLLGQPGSTITVPRYEMINEASDIAEGKAVISQSLITSSAQYTIKKVGTAVELTDEAILSGFGDPVGNATTQIANSILSKQDTDGLSAMYESRNEITVDADMGYNEIVKGVDAFVEEDVTDKVIFIHPKQVTDLRLDSNFIDMTKYGNAVLMTGEIGMVAGCRVVPSRKVIKENGYWKNPIVKLNSTETDDDIPAITMYLKKDVNIRTSIDIDKFLTKIVGSSNYVASLTNLSKVVILRTKEGTSVAPLVISYIASTYKYLTFTIPTSGYFFGSAASVTQGINFDINVTGILPLIPAATKTGLGFDSTVTNIFNAFVEIPDDGSDFDITQLKYCRNGGTLAAVEAADILDYADKKYISITWGVLDTGAGVIGNKVSGGLVLNTFDLQYKGVTKVFKFIFTNASLAV